MKTIIIIGAIMASVLSCTTSTKRDSAAATQSAQPVVSPNSSPSPMPASPPVKKSVGVDLSCKNGLDERAITVHSKDSGCEVSYTKNKETNSVASSANGHAHCDTVAKRIQTNLENAGFKCE